MANNNYKNKFKNNKHVKSFEEKVKVYDYDKIKSNDIRWWNQNSPQYELATKVPNWAHIQGAPYAIGRAVPVSLAPGWGSNFIPQFNDTNTMPGAMCLRYYPTIGISRDSTSPFNKALNILMSTLYAKTSGSALNFQQSNLAMYAVCMSNLASLFAEAKRALGVKDFWVTRNLNYPKTLFKALGFDDYNDMCKNFNSYVSRLNDLIAQFNSIKIPSWFNIFARHYSLSKNIYLDENSDFGQIYFFRTGGVWQYQDTAVPSKAKFKTIDRFDTIGDQLDLIQECLELWLNSQDLYTINGAITRAFGDGSFIMVDPMMPSDRISPAIDEFLSQQVMNTTLNGKVKEIVTADPTLWDITENPLENAIIFAPVLPYANASGEEPQNPQAMLVRSFKETPSSEDNMEMTRLSAIYKTNFELNEDGDFDGTYSLELVSCGTEVITDLEVYFPGSDTPVITVDYNANTSNAQSPYQYLDDIKALSAFRYIPRYVIGYANAAGDRSYLELGDQYNYCVLNNSDLVNLHNTALYSIWKPVIK